MSPFRCIRPAVPLFLIGPVVTAPAQEFADFSDDRLNPTRFVLSAGDNALDNAVVLSGNAPPAGDIDFFTVTVPAGLEVRDLLLTRYEAPAVSLVGFAAGALLPASPAVPEEQASFAALADGFTLVGAAEVGGNLLADLRRADVTVDPTTDEPDLRRPDAPDPDAPLPAGDYAFVFQDTGPARMIWELNFVTTPVPEPATAGTLVLLGGGGLLRRPGRAGAARRRP